MLLRRMLLKPSLKFLNLNLLMLSRSFLLKWNWWLCNVLGYVWFSLVLAVTTPPTPPLFLSITGLQKFCICFSRHQSQIETFNIGFLSKQDPDPLQVTVTIYNCNVVNIWATLLCAFRVPSKFLKAAVWLGCVIFGKFTSVHPPLHLSGKVSWWKQCFSSSGTHQYLGTW